MFGLPHGRHFACRIINPTCDFSRTVGELGFYRPRSALQTRLLTAEASQSTRHGPSPLLLEPAPRTFSIQQGHIPSGARPLVSPPESPSAKSILNSSQVTPLTAAFEQTETPKCER